MQHQPAITEAWEDQRLTPGEVRAVIGLWARRREAQERLRQQPSLQDIAEGLDISVDEVQALLTEVRAAHASVYDRWEQGRPDAGRLPPGVQSEVKMAVAALAVLFMALLSAGFLH